ncbi:MAG TPA: Glu/Leu/Phe/Val dehydrogenase dimerization domain-containing protein [Actinomycetota bacterium]|nr:Glu/Leu/Phe/Val dehydrogenase dimerization domain-containing protein [Actinomycetota bacterium]
MFEDLLRGWDGEEVVTRFDEPTGAWMFVGVHSTILGPAMGGTRLKAYAAPEDAFADVLRLSSAMTSKQAAADLPYGGGKAVLAVPSVPDRGSRERRELLLRYAGLVDSLHGTYVTAADMNTGPPDMDVIGERTPHVLGRSRERGGSGDPGGGTAIGVFHGIRATCLRAFGSPDLDGRSVLVQGAGSVGGRLLDLLRGERAMLSVSDVDAERAHAAAERVGAAIVGPADAIGAEVDVFAPCATGPVLTAETIPRLRCRAVAGAANNQLGSDADAALLTERGILYAPDYVINAGGVIHLAGYETLGWDDAAMAARLAGIGGTLAAVFAEADRDGVTTAEAADRLARARLDAGRARD